jgi:FkbM family methyltransferase
MKKLFKNILNHFGIIAFKRSSGIYIPEGESYRIVAKLCGKSAPLIIDGGAHRGDTVFAFQKHVPEARFHCFEPDPQLALHLKQTFAGDERVCVVSAALGESPATAKLNINASRPTNSLLPTADSLPSEISRLCQTVDQVSVNVVSVDSYCAENSISKVDILKLDLQGYDYNALLGARETLKKTDVVLTEVWFTEIYAGAKQLPDVLYLMQDCGFRLHTMCGLHYGEHDELLWGDAIFTRIPGHPDYATALS